MATKSDNAHLYRLDEQILEIGNGVFITPAGEEFIAEIVGGGIMSLHPLLAESGWYYSLSENKVGQPITPPTNWRDYKHTEIPLAL